MSLKFQTFQPLGRWKHVVGGKRQAAVAAARSKNSALISIGRRLAAIIPVVSPAHKVACSRQVIVWVWIVQGQSYPFCVCGVSLVGAGGVVTFVAISVKERKTI